MPALPMACGALIAVLAFYGRSWFEYSLLALALAASVPAAYYGVRRSFSYFLFGLLGGILSREPCARHSGVALRQRENDVFV